jgi:hypothetical protein
VCEAVSHKESQCDFVHSNKRGISALRDGWIAGLKRQLILRECIRSDMDIMLDSFHFKRFANSRAFTSLRRLSDCHCPIGASHGVNLRLAKF